MNINMVFLVNKKNKIKVNKVKDEKVSKHKIEKPIQE